MLAKRISLLAGAIALCAAAPALAQSAGDQPADPDAAPPPDATPVTTGPDSQPVPTQSPTTAPEPAVVPVTDTTNNNYNYYEEQPGPYSYAWNEPYLASEIGVGITVGGGIAGFANQTMRDTMSSNVAGLWDARLSIGTHVPIGLDLSYVGTAGDVNTLAGQANGTLIGSAAEAALRWNILPHFAVDPYIFGGVGWQHYDVQNRNFATSDSGMKGSDDFADFPMGVGIAWRDLSGLTLDVRGTFRATTDSTLMVDPRTGDYANMNSWEASAALGYEF
ncbi:MAG TPA: hypothetical protein VLX92_17240 [Kofleriaceae bacterium]|nr:hypothetical protein [Kofleriaceae bacterium]